MQLSRSDRSIAQRVLACSSAIGLDGPVSDTHCAVCGTSEFALIAPLFVECRGTITDVVVLGEERAGPAVVPVYGSVDRPCRTRRHQVVIGVTDGAGAWPMCSCGTYAIGVCRACARAICGDHSGGTAGGRVCDKCQSTPGVVADVALAARLTDEQSEGDRERRLADLRTRVDPLRRRLEEVERQRRAQDRHHLGSPAHAAEVRANEARVGGFAAYVSQMRAMQNAAEFRRMRDQLGCGNHDCRVGVCVELRRELGLPV